jgi:hypothetical protein
MRKGERGQCRGDRVVRVERRRVCKGERGRESSEAIEGKAGDVTKAPNRIGPYSPRAAILLYTQYSPLSLLSSVKFRFPCVLLSCFLWFLLLLPLLSGFGLPAPSSVRLVSSSSTRSSWALTFNSPTCSLLPPLISSLQRLVWRFLLFSIFSFVLLFLFAILF